VLGLPEGNLLIDTPTELRLQLIREGIGLIHGTVYTHGHADHIFGLDDLRLFPYYLGHPVPVYCEEAVEARLRKSFDYAFEVLPLRSSVTGVPQIEVRRITTEPFDLLGTRVTPIRLSHGRTDVLGFRFGNVAYCTDTNAIPEESWPKLEGLDVLILDALRFRPHPTHFSLEEAIEVAQRVGARRTLFTHISHDMEHAETESHLPESMHLAYDGLHVELS
jgi:phosphoribosyl 1,2-cyclic phosphate phosphodiesterase